MNYLTQVLLVTTALLISLSDGLITPSNSGVQQNNSIRRNNIPTPILRGISQTYNIGLSKTLLKSSTTAVSTSAVSAPAISVSVSEPKRCLNKIQSKFVQLLMVTYILSMCVSLPLALLPVYILYKAKLISRVRKERWSLKVGQFTSRWLMRIFPFASKRVVVDDDDDQLVNPQPSIWVCNHISMLDLFFVLALDKKMRGKNRRPIKILYWRGLESNPVTRVLVKMCGFIPVDMSDNGNGNANEYDVKSFKDMLKRTKQAIDEGFDIGILPEGQPNPTPETGMQPIFSGAFTLARMSRRPIKMISLYGLNKMWHPEGHMPCTSREMAIRVYPNGRVYKDADEFSSTFSTVAGHFGANGKDLSKEELGMWLDGSMWQTELSRRAATRLRVEDIDNEEAKMETQDNEPVVKQIDAEQIAAGGGYGLAPGTTKN